MVTHLRAEPRGGTGDRPLELLVAERLDLTRQNIDEVVMMLSRDGDLIARHAILPDDPPQQAQPLQLIEDAVHRRLRGTVTALAQAIRYILGRDQALRATGEVLDHHGTSDARAQPRAGERASVVVA
jgi:hypothetical protein